MHGTTLSSDSQFQRLIFGGQCCFGTGCALEACTRQPLSSLCCSETTAMTEPQEHARKKAQPRLQESHGRTDVDSVDSLFIRMYCSIKWYSTGVQVISLFAVRHGSPTFSPVSHSSSWCIVWKIAPHWARMRPLFNTMIQLQHLATPMKGVGPGVSVTINPVERTIHSPEIRSKRI
jgi:hypothetical protein